MANTTYNSEKFKNSKIFNEKNKKQKCVNLKLSLWLKYKPINIINENKIIIAFQQNKESSYFTVLFKTYDKITTCPIFL